MLPPLGTPFRVAQLYAGHPRLNGCEELKTWMAGTSPAMTSFDFKDPAQDPTPHRAQGKSTTGKSAA